MSRTFEEYLEIKCWDNWPNIFSEYEAYFINSEPNDPNVLECKDKMINEI